MELNNLNTTPMSQAVGSVLLEHESRIWSTADTLRSVGIKPSEWPSYMMPFFALVLVESRIIRAKLEEIKEFEKQTGEKFDDKNDYHVTAIDNAVESLGYGYHPEIVKYGRTLASLTETQPADFYSRVMEYVQKFDTDTKRLLGIDYSQGTAKFLDLQGIIGQLNAKKQSDSEDVLFSFTKKWAQVNLVGASNSEVTTIEEHIKRKWADISAETAGEQYTPSDIIDLNVLIHKELAPIDPEGTWSVYDMTCGGGNFLYGVADALRAAYPSLSISTYGQEFNDQLYSFSAIEARFRPDSHIQYGNTLTNDKFMGKSFKSIVGNPPYGTDWKEFKSAIENEAKAGGRFSLDMLPPTSDGQLLFLVHAESHLADNGLATIVHSGSSLFSGDAEGGESNIRKYLMAEKDVVHAIIQLPNNIFFNTGINTYIWVLNKAKPAELKNKVMLIDASSLFEKLKKNLNKKNCIIPESLRKEIVAQLKAGKPTEITKVVSVDDLLYNKVELSITRTGDDGNYVGMQKKLTSNVNYIKITTSSDNNLEFTVVNGVPSSEAVTKESLKLALDSAVSIDVGTENGTVDYYYDVENNEVLCDGENLGKGVIQIKALAPKKGAEGIRLDVTVSPLIERDSEVVPFSSDPVSNNRLITDFRAKWIKEPHSVEGTKVGCEINFNKIFPKAVEVRTVADVMAEMADLEKELAELSARGGV